jgi:hypothetical protein
VAASDRLCGKSILFGYPVDTLSISSLLANRCATNCVGHVLGVGEASDLAGAPSFFAMQVTVLTIVCGDEHAVSLHAAQKDAWAALLGFVTANWDRRFSDTPMPVVEAERVSAFFGQDDFYLIAEADLSAVEQYLNEIGDFDS